MDGFQSMHLMAYGGESQYGTAYSRDAWYDLSNLSDVFKADICLRGDNSERKRTQG